MAQQPPVLEVPYLIVGAGPVGLTTALLLADRGRECMVVERRDGPQRHPAAHVVNARTLEIFRQAGVDFDAIDAVAQDPEDAGHVNFVTTLNGQLIGRLPFERQGDECLNHTPTPLRNISQHHLEPILAEAVTDSTTADLRYRTRWESGEQHPDGVTSIVTDLETGQPMEVRSRYVVAADGAGSRVRKSRGVNMVGPASLRSFITIHVGADLRHLVADRPGVLHWVMDPAAAGTFVAHDIDREWVFMVGFDPEEESVDDYSAARCQGLVRAALGDTDDAIDILGVGSWHMSAQVADRMRDGRIFLVGDAAHRFPPTGGLGLNTGVADAHNLIWKLGAVDDGWADPALLDSYQSERRPVAGINCEQSTSNAFKMVTLYRALGLTTSPTTEQLLTTIADPTKAAGIAAAVADQATHFDMLGLQLGYVYAVGALVRRGDPPAPPADPSRFEPDAAVGSRLPHGWTDDGRSTLDLIDSRGLTLISFGHHETWAAALSKIDAPIVQVRIDPDTGAGPNPGADLDSAPDSDSDPDAPDSDPEPATGSGATGGTVVAGGWPILCRMEPGGALLVRPDQHIAWRSEPTSTATEPGALSEAVDQVLGR